MKQAVKKNEEAGAPKRRKRLAAASTREHLIEHARQLLREKGFKEASIGQLVARAGGSKETIYRHFKSKEDLVAQVFAAEHQHSHEVFASLDNPYVGIEDGLRNLIKGLLLELTSERSIAVRRMMTSEARGHPEIGRLYYAQFSRKGYDLLQEFVERHQVSGDLKPLDPCHLAEYLAAMALSRIMITRQCNVIKPLTATAARCAAARIAGDFLDAFGVGTR